MIKRHFILIFSLLFAAGCSSGEKESNKDSDHMADGTIVLTKKQFGSSGMTFSGFKKVNASEKVDATGKIKVKPENYFMLSTLMKGRVKQVFVTQGEWVKTGQPLVEIEDPSFIRLQQEYLDALARMPVLKSDFERQKELFSDQVASEKEFQRAKADYLSAKARVAGLKSQLKLLGVNSDGIRDGDFRSSLVLKAPIDGNISAMKAQKGVYLEEGAEVLEVINPSGLFVSLNVFESDVLGIEKGVIVLVRSAGGTSEQDTAMVERITQKVDEDTRSLIVHASLAKEGSHFIPGMYLDAQIIKGIGDRIVLPEDAVVEIENRHWVLLRKEEKEDSFILIQKEVNVRELDGGMFAVLNHNDFSENAVFLCKGAFALIQ